MAILPRQKKFDQERATDPGRAGETDASRVPSQMFRRVGGIVAVRRESSPSSGRRRSAGCGPSPKSRKWQTRGRPASRSHRWNEFPWQRRHSGRFPQGPAFIHVRSRNGANFRSQTSTKESVLSGPSVVGRILRHLHLPTVPPPVSPARSRSCSAGMRRGGQAGILDPMDDGSDDRTDPARSAGRRRCRIKRHPRRRQRGRSGGGSAELRLRVYSDADLTNLVAWAGGIAQVETMTSWQVDAPLESGTYATSANPSESDGTAQRTAPPSPGQTPRVALR